MGDERLKNWLGKMKWSFNPFVFDICPQYMVGFEKYIKNIYFATEQSIKYILITAPTGSGKTMLMNFLCKNSDNADFNYLYISKPPKNPDDLSKIITNKLNENKRKNQNFIASLLEILMNIIKRKEEVTLYNLNLFIEKSPKKVVLLIDEAHETNIETLEWIRTITDTTSNMITIMAGLPALKKEKLNQLETFMQRVSLDITIEPLNKNQSVELIKKRISLANGSMIDPFTADCIELVHRQSGGFPREIIKICNNLINRAIEQDITIIDASCMDDKKQEEKTVVSLIESLTEKQKDILNLIKKSGKLTPSALAKSADASCSYKSKTHALRALNNILKRLENIGLLERQKSGRTYAYRLASKARNVMTKA